MAGGQSSGQASSSSTGMGVNTATSPDALNPQATYPGTRYGQMGMAPGSTDADASDQTIVSRGTPGGSGNGS